MPGGLKSIVLVVLLSLGLAACDRGPTAEALKADLAAYIDAGTTPGLFEVTAAERLDHRTLPDLRRAPRTVTYRATLRLKRDTDFGAWEQAGAGALTLLLGASAEDVRGLAPGGNKSGDNIVINGTLVFGKTDERWRLLTSAPPAPPPLRPSDDRQSLLTDWLPFTRATARAVFTRPGALPYEMAASRKQLEARLARQSGGVAVASGAAGTDAWAVMGTIARETPQPGAPLNVTTSGSRENLALLRSGAVSAVVLRGDEAALAALGQGPFENDGIFPTLRVVASLFPEQMHVVVNGTSSIASIVELFGKRVVVAASGPTALRQADDILRAHRVALAGNALEEMPLSAALALLQKGERDALILMAAAPSTELRRFASTHAIRFLPLDADAVALMTTGTSNYVAVTLPGQVYPGQSRTVASVGVAAQLISSSAIPGAEIEHLLGRTFAERDGMAGGSAVVAMVRRSTAQRWLTLPLHSGAETFFGVFEPPK